MAALTDSGTLVRMAYQGLINLNVDADEVLRRCGLDPAQLYKLLAKLLVSGARDTMKIF